jgi:hypothetical protein
LDGAGGGGGDAAGPVGVDAATDGPLAASGLPALQFCTVANASNLSAAFTSQNDGHYFVYSCTTPCNGDWTTCMVDGVTSQGSPAMSLRGNLPIKLLAFVVDDMAGHIEFTSDGDNVVITHAGVGGTTLLNGFDTYLQQHSTLKTVTLGWEEGSHDAFGGGNGWFTRKSAQPSTVRDQAVRPAAVIQWVKDHFAAGKKLGTVGQSMGTVATLGAHVWYGLEPIIDYQMLLGGPGLWDINAGCGRVHTSEGYCDVDVSPCTGNPLSSYGNDDPYCGDPATFNSCRVPTIMAPQGTGSEFNNIINYVGATTACAPSMTDNRDPSLDVSSFMTLTDWAFHGKIDLVADEGGSQPPNADQGMGEGHMMRLYRALTGPKSWTDNQGHHHGDSFNNASLGAPDKVITEMSN